MDQVSLSGRTVIVTGASAGIGKETAKALARRGARVILACRSQQKADEVRLEIEHSTKNDNVVVKILDLSSLRSVQRFADDILLNENRLDILVNNAAVVTSTRETTEDGFELVFGVNHLGHFYLTYLLLEKLKSSAPSRIVTVSSEAHEMNALDFNDLQTKLGWGWLKAYGRSKTANILFTVHLAKLLKDTDVTTYSLHPGIVDTEIERQIGELCSVKCFNCIGPCIGYGKVRADQGALTTLYCCLEPSLTNETGLYYEKQRRKRAKRHATDPDLAERLWEISKQLCGLER